MLRLSLPFRLLVAVALAASLIAPASAQRPEPKREEIRGFTMYTVLNPGDIPAIFEPEFVTVEQARDLYYPDEPLIAVVDGDSTKGYSTWHLDGHEVVNDYINGRAITVTW